MSDISYFRIIFTATITTRSLFYIVTDIPILQDFYFYFYQFLIVLFLFPGYRPCCSNNNPIASTTTLLLQQQPCCPNNNPAVRTTTALVDFYYFLFVQEFYGIILPL